jgi:hypothetical protein
LGEIEISDALEDSRHVVVKSPNSSLRCFFLFGTVSLTRDADLPLTLFFRASARAFNPLPFRRKGYEL